MTSQRLLNALLNPTLPWLSLLPLMGIGWLWSDGVSRHTPHLVATLLLALCALLQYLLKYNYRNLHALLPLLLLIPLDHLLRYRTSFGAVIGEHILWGELFVTAVWGLYSVRTCALSTHPVCHELQFTHKAMVGITLALLILWGFVAHQLPWLPVALFVGTWLLHTARILWQQGREWQRAYHQQAEECFCECEIRVAIVRGQELLLTPNANDGKLDHPFATCKNNKEERPAALKRLQGTMPAEMKPRFLLRYHVDNGPNSRVVYLYVVNLGLDCPLPSLLAGEWWHASQILQARQKGEVRLASRFVEEFKYLRHSILLANSIVSKKSC